jgi:hypothetical protein
MATPYEIVYGRFLNKCSDFNLADLDDHTLNEMMKDWLDSAIIRTRTSSDLSARDDEAEEFENDLSGQDVELLSMGMVLAWLDQQIQSTEYTSLFIGGKEQKFYAPSAQLAELRNLRADILREMQQLHCYNTYTNNSYFND